jgi:signal transduction histidine kinase
MLIPAPLCRFLAAAGGLALLVAVPLADLAFDHTISAEQLAFTVGFLLPFYATGLYGFWRRSDLSIARLLLATASTWALFANGDVLLRAVLEQGNPPAGVWLANLALLGAGCVAFVLTLSLLALFPDGRFHRAYERRLILPLWCLPVVVPLLAALTSPSLHVANDSSTPTVHNPLAIEGALGGLEDLPEVLFSLLATVFVPMGIVMLIVRYRRLGPEQRGQVRWLLLVSLIGVMVASALALLADIAGGFVDVIAVVVGFAFLALVPVAILVAILRYRLFDVDVLIRKSLVYGSLWLLISAIYALAAVALGVAAGDQLPVTLAILLTVLATLVFQPARRRLELIANRWVFGERTSRYELLAGFGAELERTLSVDELLPRLAETAQAGLDARWARISLSFGSGEAAVLAPRASIGVDLHAEAEPSLSSRLAVADSDMPVGMIECGPRSEGGYTEEDQSLLDTLARQAALAVRNATLASELSARLDEIRLQADELAASRARIVHAQESERRRIERNIHDGVQQELVALIASLRLARNQLDRDPGAASATLSGLQEEVKIALEDLRNLAQGIHPAVLSDRGLVPAIEARARAAPLPVSMHADETVRGLRFGDDLEGAAYFVAGEGLANALKHAQADSIELFLTYDDEWLTLEVRDDGIGFAPLDTPRRGLANLEDRVAALGGRLAVESEPGRGTAVRCRLRASVRAMANA